MVLGSSPVAIQLLLKVPTYEGVNFTVLTFLGLNLNFKVKNSVIKILLVEILNS